MGNKIALDPICELVHILARWTCLHLLRQCGKVQLLLIDSNRFSEPRKQEIFEMELAINEAATSEHNMAEEQPNALLELQLALVGGGIGDVIPA